MGRSNRIFRLAILAAVVSLAAVGAIVAPARSMAAPARPAATVSSAVTSFSAYGYLDGVSATSASNAWAVGSGPAGKTLLLHWNGAKWSQVTSPKPVQGALTAVTAVSADDAWAVGFLISPPSCHCQDKPLIMHWNGRAWSRQVSVPVVWGELNGVAVSGSSVWAVGSSNLNVPLILHRTGSHWYVVPSQVGEEGALVGVTIAGAKTAWASGYVYLSNGGQDVLLMRWNGSVWKTVANPLQHEKTLYNSLNAVAAGPAGAVWAVGPFLGYGVNAASMLWNGKTWRIVPVPDGIEGRLSGVTFFPGGTAWAVGTGDNGTLILRWTGRAWATAAIAKSGTDDFLDAIAATSRNNAWAVGGTGKDTVILHWNGKIWS
jgi:hypothetical protein